MDRRAHGGLALTLALVTVLTGSRLLNPSTVDGAAVVEPPPPPPSVGVCLAGSVTSSWDATGTLRPSDTVYVPCDQPHRGEVFAVVDPIPPLSSTETVFGLCTLPVASYLGVDSGWQPELSVRSTASGPDRRQADVGQNWAACVLVDDVGPRATTSLAGAARRHSIPPQLGACFDGPATDLAYRGTSACESPHGGELFGTQPLDATTDRTALAASCRALVAADTARPTLADDPALVVEVVGSRDIPQDLATHDAAATPSPAAVTGTARCVVRALDGRRLTASLRQIGDAPLPWAG